MNEYLLSTTSSFYVLLAQTHSCLRVALRGVGVGTRLVTSTGFAALVGKLVVVWCADVTFVSCHSRLALTLAFCVTLKAARS